MSEAAVLGNGVIGLLTAKCLQDRGYNVTILADRKPEETTSAAAGAILLPFFPFEPGTVEFERRMRWQQSSQQAYWELNQGEFCIVVQHREFWKDGLLEGAFPLEWLADVKLPSVQHVTLDRSFNGYDGFINFPLTCVDSRKLLRYLTVLSRERGAVFRDVHVDSRTLSELKEPVIFNCLGFGSAQVFDDPSMTPVFGQALRFPAIDQRFGIGIGDFFALSTSYNFYVGSPFVEGVASREPITAWSERLLTFTDDPLRDLLELVGLGPVALSRGAGEIVTGIRPYRKAGVRVELERISGKNVVHNYGHGGHGWTLGWGSVVDAVDMWEAMATG